MTTDESGLEIELSRILSKVFSLDLQLGVDNSEELKNVIWDSLKTVQIVLELEDSFSIEISDSDLQNIRDFRSTLEYVRRKILPK
jgi:acyl carrier protein